MAKLKANKKPVHRKTDNKPFIGTCSNCRITRTEVVKVRGSQVCTSKCLGGVSYAAPEPEKKTLAQIATEIFSGNANSGLPVS